MADTEDQLRQQLVDSIGQEAPATDVLVGAAYNMLIGPVPAVLAPLGDRIDRIERMVTGAIGEVIDDQEALQIARTFGIPVPQGRAARGTLLLVAFSRPTRVLGYRGTLAGTDDGQFMFYLTQSITVEGDAIDGYYSAARRRYEFPAQIEATAVGEDHNIAPERIKRLFTPVDGIDTCVNLVRTRSGIDPGDLSTTVQAAQDALLGLDPDSAGGMVRALLNHDPDNVIGFALVFPKDTTLFRRRTSRPAIDIYINGTDPETDAVTMTAAGGEQVFVLPRPPVLSVESCTVNGAAVTYELLQDTSVELQRSARANDRVRITTPLNALDSLRIDYTYDRLHRSFQEEVLDADIRPFDTDILARRADEVDLDVMIDATVVSSRMIDTARNSITDLLFALVEDGTFGATIIPQELETALKARISGVTDLAFTVFARVLGRVQSVETIFLKRNQIPKISIDLLTVNVHGTING